MLSDFLTTIFTLYICYYLGFVKSTKCSMKKYRLQSRRMCTQILLVLQYDPTQIRYLLAHLYNKIFNKSTQKHLAHFLRCFIAHLKVHNQDYNVIRKYVKNMSNVCCVLLLEVLRYLFNSNTLTLRKQQFNYGLVFMSQLHYKFHKQ